MNVILIDDEQHALDLLEFHLNSNFKDVTILEKFQNPTRALIYLKEHRPDLIFMDVDMPGITGLEMGELLESMQIPIVFVTAHSSYAIPAIKLNVFDYLLKPINTEELQRVYAKAKEKVRLNKELSDKIEFKISNRHVIVQRGEVLYVSSEGNYSTVHFLDRPELMITKNMKKMIEDYFNGPDFFRAHRSYLVNLNHVTEYNNHEIVLSGDRTVSLARNNVDELKAKMGERF